MSMSAKTVITRGSNTRQFYQEILEYKELMLFLTWRDILVRYKQTTVGVAWAVIQPVIVVSIFTLIFGRFAKFPSQGLPYPLIILSAMLVWHFFSQSLSEGGNSLVSNSNIVSKIYFPKIIFPLSSILVCMVDLLIGLVIFLVAMMIFGVRPSLYILYLPVFFCWLLILSAGVTFWISAMNVKYRDFRYLIPVIIQVGIYISPVGFISAVVPHAYRWLYSLNPLVGIIDGFRWSLLGGQFEPYWLGLILSAIVTLLIFLTGIRYFRKTERYFSDII